MKMNMAVGILLFGVSLFTNCMCVIEEQGLTFQQANKSCESKGLSLLPYGEELVIEVLRTKFKGYLWVGSPWYKGIGCFMNEPNETIHKGSLYNCSTSCIDKRFTHLGLAENSCACFTNLSEFNVVNCHYAITTTREGLKFGKGDNNWYIYQKEWSNDIKTNAVHVSEKGIFTITSSNKQIQQYICSNMKPQTTVEYGDKDEKDYSDMKPQTTVEYGDKDEKDYSDNSFIIQIVVAVGVAVLLIIFVSVVAIIMKRNHTEIAREETEMQIMKHDYSSVQKVGRPTGENPSNDADVSWNKPQGILKENEGNADTDVYDMAGASNNTQTNSSEIYDHTNSTEGVYDITDHVKQKENDVDNTYDHV